MEISVNVFFVSYDDWCNMHFVWLFAFDISHNLHIYMSHCCLRDVASSYF